MAEIKTIDEVKKDVRQFIINNFFFGSEKDRFKDKDSFLENGIIDSTGVLELIQFIEERYRMKCKDDELIPENLDSLNNIANYVINKMKNYYTKNNVNDERVKNRAIRKNMSYILQNRGLKKPMLENNEIKIYHYIARDETVRQFGIITEENNLLHYDDDFAKKTRFKRRIIPGMLSASFIATSVWKAFGDGTVFVNQKLNFIKPVFVEDKISVELNVLNISYLNEMKLKVVCKVEDEIRIDGELIILLPD